MRADVNRFSFRGRGDSLPGPTYTHFRLHLPSSALPSVSENQKGSEVRAPEELKRLESNGGIVVTVVPRAAPEKSC